MSEETAPGVVQMVRAPAAQQALHSKLQPLPRPLLSRQEPRLGLAGSSWKLAFQNNFLVAKRQREHSLVSHGHDSTWILSGSESFSRARALTTLIPNTILQHHLQDLQLKDSTPLVPEPK